MLFKIMTVVLNIVRWLNVKCLLLIKRDGLFQGDHNDGTVGRHWFSTLPTYQFACFFSVTDESQWNPDDVSESHCQLRGAGCDNVLHAWCATKFASLYFPLSRRAQKVAPWCDNLTLTLREINLFLARISKNGSVDQCMAELPSTSSQPSHYSET